MAKSPSDRFGSMAEVIEGEPHSGVAQVLHSLMPALSVELWVLPVVAVSLALLLGGGYKRIESLAMVKVGFFTMLTVLSAAIGYARDGYPVASRVARDWAGAVALMQATGLLAWTIAAVTPVTVRDARPDDAVLSEEGAEDPRRFRGNILIDGLPAWAEFAWLGHEIRIGAARLKVVDRIARCAATNVNPDSAERDMNIPLTLRKGFGHIDMGVYALVVDGRGTFGGKVKLLTAAAVAAGAVAATVLGLWLFDGEPDTLPERPKYQSFALKEDDSQGPW